MAVTNKNEALLLFFGDLFFFAVSLWLTLFFRFLEIPARQVFFEHLQPFAILFFLWVIVFFISGLYEKHTLILKSRIPTTIFNAQLVNSIIAVLFFYFVPFFEIAPKTNLFVYIIISFFAIWYWRINGIEILSPRVQENAVLIGTGQEMNELKEEVNNNSRYGLHFVSSFDIKDANLSQDEIIKAIRENKVSIVAADLRNSKIEPLLPNLYGMIFSQVRVVDMYQIYEDIFDRVPMSLINYDWFLENVSVSTTKIYDFFKRFLDLVGAITIGLVSLIFYPFVVVAIKLEDGGPIFITQQRVGKNNKIIGMTKFRSMTTNDQGEYSGAIAKDNRITKVGAIIRKLRIDELPQLWNVIKGDLSLIGPRPELPALVEQYAIGIPYYNIRHIIKPGLSGWAQLYQRVPPKGAVAVNETKLKLSYDLYYLKNRSFMLDLKIGIKTIKTLVSIAGI